MNSSTQLEFHPDAESLSAFAERALPERERGQIVAHLAVCSRCRDVIFLAQQAVMEMEVAAAPAARTAWRGWSWLSGWRLAWIPAAALAAVVGLAFLVHGRHEETGTEMARVVPQAVPHEDGNAAKPAAKERVFAKKEHAPVSNVMGKQPEIKVESAPVGSAYVPLPAETAPLPAAATETVTVTSAPPLMTTNGLIGQGIRMNEFKPEPMLEARQSLGASHSSNATVVRAPGAKMDEMDERSQASRKTKAKYAGSGGVSTLQLKNEALPSSGFDAGAQMPLVQFTAAGGASIAPLPSGLGAVSSVTAANCTLAIDQAGALFLSRDSGSHWESVARQWTGRAVNVSLLPTLNGRSFVAAPTRAAAAAPTAPAEVFELRNDKNLTWVSADGVIWTAQ
ncbi:MAG: zf-HC2 domain-containing protein [Terracidiphilus sp.]|jgi:hypothetical protein